MATGRKLIPSGSQTVGPYFSIGLERLIDEAPAVEAAEIEIRGRVLDCHGAPVSDAMLEFWSMMKDGASEEGFPAGFRRSATDADGRFSVRIERPSAVAFETRGMQAPHFLVLVFARGLLRHLISRVYFEGEPGNVSDPVLLAVPPERRETLIARRQKSQRDSYVWNVVLQGLDETVFFAW
jgi:protocatechuate 3,4-dioxygenase alpha subunit